MPCANGLTALRPRSETLHGNKIYIPMSNFKTKVALTMVVGVAILAVGAIATLIQNSVVFAVLIVGLGIIRFVSLSSLLPRWMHPIFYVLAIGCLTTICLTF